MEQTATKYAVIDIGSNSIRAAFEEGGALPRKQLFTTKLGSGLNETGRLADENMRLSLDAISKCADRARAEGFSPVAYATSAVRDAANGAEFARRVEAECGVPVEIISGEDEARYAFLGAAGGEGGFDSLLDIGGASMQVVKNGRGVSFRAGCVRCTDMIKDVGMSRPGTDIVIPGASGVWDTHPYAKRKAIREYLMKEVQLPESDYDRVVGVGGSITTLAAYSLNLKEYDPSAVDRAKLTHKGLEILFFFLQLMGDKGRRGNPLLCERHDTILTGLTILEYAMEAMGIGELAVSTRDGMEGYLYELKRRES